MSMLFITSLFYPEVERSRRFSYNEIKMYFSKISNLIKAVLLLVLLFGFTMKHVDVGFEFGQNGLLKQIRDLFWNLRHLNF